MREAAIKTNYNICNYQSSDCTLLRLCWIVRIMFQSKIRMEKRRIASCETSGFADITECETKILRFFGQTLQSLFDSLCQAAIWYYREFYLIRVTSNRKCDEGLNTAGEGWSNIIARFKRQPLTAYANVTIGRCLRKVEESIFEIIHFSVAKTGGTVP